MHDEDDTPITDEEREDALRGQALIAAAMADTRAPHTLRERLEDDRARAGSPPQSFWRGRRRAIAAGVCAALAAAVAGMVALGPGSGPDAPSLAQVEAAARARPAAPAPASLGGRPPVLDASVGGLTFPDWDERYAWKATGARTDEIAGRTVKTVFYRNPKGAELGYAVVDGEELDDRARGRTVTRNGETYRVGSTRGRTVVTWTQMGHTCVIVGEPSVPASRLVDLAAWSNS